MPRRTFGRPAVVVARDRLPGAWALFAVFVGPAVAAFCMSIEPPSSNPDAPVPLYVSLIGFGLLASWAGAAVSGLRRRPLALAWATAAGVLSIAATVTCPVSAHHVGVGAWWAWQFAASGTATAVAAVGWSRQRS